MKRSTARKREIGPNIGFRTIIRIIILGKGHIESACARASQRIYRRSDEWLLRNESRGFVAELIIVGPDAAGRCVNVNVFIVGHAEAEYESLMRKSRAELSAAHATFRIPFTEKAERARFSSDPARIKRSFMKSCLVY